jgi:LacI family transcriptional regulator
MSIQALADSLGLSISTVSRALNGYSDVSIATRARVAAAADAMNYKPHPLARRLATGRIGAVALLFSGRVGNRQESTLASLMSGATEEMRRHSYFTMAVGLPMGDQELIELDRFIIAKLVDGVMLVRPYTNDQRVAMLQARKVPLVTYGRTLDNAPHAWVDVDNVAAYVEATAQLIALGHRRIALLSGPSHMTFAVHREQGFLQALKTAGIAPLQCPIINTNLSSEEGALATHQLLTTGARPSAILGVTDALALGASQAVAKLHLKVGHDVSVMGFGNIDAGEFCTPPLSTIDHGIVNSGRQLARTLLEVMRGTPIDTLHYLEKPQLLMRESVGVFSKKKLEDA